MVLDIVDEFGERIDVTSPAAALSVTAIVEGHHIMSALGQESPDMVVATRMLADSVYENDRRPRCVTRLPPEAPPPLELGQSVPGAGELLVYEEIGHSMRVPSGESEARLLAMEQIMSLRFVAIGGVTGAVLRWIVVSVVGKEWVTEATFGLNVFGALLLGVVVGLRLTRRQEQRLTADQFLLLGTGFCGALTTFSAYAVQVAELLDSGAALTALGAGLATPAAAVVAAGLGYRVGSRP